MANPLSALSFLTGILEKLRNAIMKYQKKKRMREKLLTALASETKSFENAFNEISEIGITRLIPLLGSIKIYLTRSQINDIVICVSDIQSEYAKLLQSYVKIAKGCDEVSLNEAFMMHLKKTNAMLHDFVLAMKNTLVTEDSIKIDNKFYRFVKLYENQILKYLKAKDVEDVIEEIDVKRYLNIAKKKIKPSFRGRKRSIKSKNLKRYLKALNKLNEAAKKVKIQKTTMVELKPYMPSKLLPLVDLIEEFCPLA